MAAGSELIIPSEVAEALDRLVDQHGLTNDLFYAVHHFWQKGRKETIRSHRNWAAKQRHYHDHQPNNIITGCRIIEWLRLVEAGVSLEAARVSIRGIKSIEDVRETVRSWRDGSADD